MSFQEECNRAVLTLSHARKSRLTDNAYLYLSRLEQQHVTFESLYECIESRQEEEPLLRQVVSVYQGKNNNNNNKSARVLDTHVYTALMAHIPEELTQEAMCIWEVYQARPNVLYLLHLALLVTRPPSFEIIPISKIPKKYTTLVEDELLPDFVYDHHTTRGRQLGRDFRHFVRVSCVLENCHLPDPYYKQLLAATE